MSTASVVTAGPVNVPAPDFKKALDLLKERKPGLLVEMAKEMGCYPERWQPPSPEKTAVEKLLVLAATHNKNGNTSPFMHALCRAAERSIGLAGLADAFGAAISSAIEPSKLLSNPANHDFLKAELGLLIPRSVEQRDGLWALDVTIERLIAFNCEAGVRNGLSVSPHLIPNSLISASVQKQAPKVRHEMYQQLVRLANSKTIEEFLVDRVKNTRTIVPFVGGDKHESVLQSIEASVTPEELKRYRMATSGAAGEAEFLGALARREAWSLPPNGTRLGVFCDCERTLFNGGDVNEGRFALLIQLKESGVPVHLITAGYLPTVQAQADRLGGGLVVFSKQKLSGVNVHVLIDDEVPENQRDCPNPKVFIKA